VTAGSTEQSQSGGARRCPQAPRRPGPSLGLLTALIALLALLLTGCGTQLQALATGSTTPPPERPGASLFLLHRWTPLDTLADFPYTLPPDLRHRAGDFPSDLWWAYGNDLSAGTDFDFTQFLGEQVRVVMYRLAEPPPAARWATARGIVVVADGRVVGAWVDNGRGGFGTTVSRRPLSSTTGLGWDRWLESYVDLDDPLDAELSGLSPQQVVIRFFKAVDRGDPRTARACLTRRTLARSLWDDVPDHQLYNPDFTATGLEYDNVLSAQIAGPVSRPVLSLGSRDTVVCTVPVALRFRTAIATPDGTQRMVLTLRQEVKGLGWRIENVWPSPTSLP